MTPKEKMQKLIKNKQGGGKDIQRSIAKNDQKYMWKTPMADRVVFQAHQTTSDH